MVESDDDRAALLADFGVLCTFYGDRSGMITDPFGHRWSFATHKEDVSPEEVQRRAKELFGQ